MSRILERVWMVSDHRYNPKDLGGEVVHLRETPPHALSHANTEPDEREKEMDRLAARARVEFDLLRAVDREILRLSQLVDGVREQQTPFPASKRDEQEQAGWLFVRATKGGYVLMAKQFPTGLTHEEIGERLTPRLNARQVRYRLSQMSPDLVRFAVLKGWV